MTHFTVDWYINNRILLATITSSFLDVPEIQTINDALMERIRASDAAALYAILDCRKVEKFQPNITLISQALTFLREPRLRWVLTACDDQLLKLTVTVVAQLTHTNLHHAPGVEEAVAFIRAVDATLASNQ